MSSGIIGIGARRIFLYEGVCDMRRSFDRLAGMIKAELKEDPLSGDLYVFLNRSQRKVKCLYWDRDGYVLWYKRLEKGRFVRPRLEGNELDPMHWTHLLEGIEAQVIKRQPRHRILEEKNLKTSLLDEEL